MINLIGSVLIQNENKNKREILITVGEQSGNIFVNGELLQCGYNIEKSIRIFANIGPEFNILTTYFTTVPESRTHFKKNFIDSWWEDFAIEGTVVQASVLITKMDYESGYDSFS